MTPEQWAKIASEVGIPFAIALFLLVAFGTLTAAAVSGVKWTGHRLFGETGMMTQFLHRHIQFLDTVERNDDRHAEALDVLTSSTQAMHALLEKTTTTDTAKLDAIHEDVKQVKEAVWRKP